MNKEQPSFMKKYGWAILICLVLVAGLVTAIVMGVGQNNAIGSMRTRLEGVYQSAFHSAGNHMVNIQTDLTKLRVTTSSSQRVKLLYSIWRLCTQTQEGVAELPLEQSQSEAILRFINQMGDYCYMLAKRVEEGKGITDEEKQTLNTLNLQCGELASHLEAGMANGIDWAQSEKATLEGLDLPKLDEIGKLSESIEEYPTLIYDGPFSDRAKNKEAANNKMEIVPYEKALEVAQQYVQGEFTRTDDQPGTIPTYNMTCVREDGTSIDIRIAQHGGQLYEILPRTASQTDTLPTDEQVPELTRIAKEYLDTHGFPSMAPAYAQYYAGCAVVNMAFMQGEVKMYPDLIKVWVDVATGEILGVDAHNYLLTHHERSLPAPTQKLNELQARVAQSLEIEHVGLAVIPQEDMSELLCYEFVGKNGDDKFSLYLSAATGEEVDIKLIIDAEDGSFTY